MNLPARIAALAASLLAASSLQAAVLPPLACATSAQSSGVVVRFSSTDERRFCVEFARETIPGIEALRRTGLSIRLKDYGGSLGAAVCMIDGFGNDLSECPGAKGHWHYWHWDGYSWRESSLGASRYLVRDGAVEGWTWEAGGAATAPGTVELERICSSTRRRVAPAGPPRRAGASIDALVFVSVLVALGALGFSASRRGGGAASG